MNSIKQDLVALLTHALHNAFPQADLSQLTLDVSLSTQVEFGHYQCNSAMRLGKSLGIAPKEIAARWLTSLSTGTKSDLVAQAEIAGPGFINLWLTPQAISQRLNVMAQCSHLGITAHANQRVVIDFSSPNIAKQMHVGHLRSTVIGDCLARLFEYLGFDVLRLNHVGDWGTAFGMLIAYLKHYQPDVLTGDTTTDLNHLVNWYRDAKQHFDQDEHFKKTAQQEVVALQNGQSESLKAWHLICAISRDSYQAIYDLLDVRIVERGESFYNPMLADIVQHMTTQGLATESAGALCIFLDGFKNRDGSALPLIIRKSDGGYNYASTDLAAVAHRVQTEGAQRILYLTDAGQAQHFAMVFEACKQVGYLQTLRGRVRLDHVPFGLVLGPDGKKFKTRSGDTEPLIDLLYAAIEAAKSILQARDLTLDETTLQHTAQVLGINAIKYADLSNNRIHDYVFSYERMLRFEGNTAAFLMYSYVRIHSLKRRANVEATRYTACPIQVEVPAEIDLGLHLVRFEEVLCQVSEDLLPHRLCEYLFQLAEKFNAFFRDCRVEGTAQQNQRLHLCDLTERILQTGMQLLGLRCIDKM